MYYFYNEDCILGAKEHIADESVDLIITDPPFGINGDKPSRAYRRKEEFVLPGYIEIKQSNYLEFTEDWVYQAERILKPGGQIYVVSGYTNLLEILQALRASGLKEVNHIIWKYSFGLPTKHKFISSHYHVPLYEKFSKKHPRIFNRDVRFKDWQKGESGKSLVYEDMEDVWRIKKEYHPGKVKTINSFRRL